MEGKMSLTRAQRGLWKIVHSYYLIVIMVRLLLFVVVCMRDAYIRSIWRFVMHL